MLRAIKATVFVWAVLANAQPGGAQQLADVGAFDLFLGNIKVAELSYSGQLDSAAYAVRAHVESTGVMSAIKRIRYDGVSTGAVIKGSFVPSSYRESADTGKRQSDTVLEYQDGVPRVVSYAPEALAQSGPVDPATMGGSVDPLTAFFAAVRAVDDRAECLLSLSLFDGRRASQLLLGRPNKAGDTIVCPGVYVRDRGFTPEDMAQKRRFNFIMTLAPAEQGQMQVAEIISETIYGKVTLKRR